MTRLISAAVLFLATTIAVAAQNPLPVDLDKLKDIVDKLRQENAQLQGGAAEVAALRERVKKLEADNDKLKAELGLIVKTQSARAAVETFFGRLGDPTRGNATGLLTTDYYNNIRKIDKSVQDPTGALQFMLRPLGNTIDACQITKSLVLPEKGEALFHGNLISPRGRSFFVVELQDSGGSWLVNHVTLTTPTRDDGSPK